MSCRFVFGTLLGVIGLGVGALAQSPGTAPPAPGLPAARANPDGALVEHLLAIRRDYHITLDQLRAQYMAAGDLERARWAEEELRQFLRIPKEAYRLELDVPPSTLQPVQNLPEANELYRRAMTYKDKGWGTEYIDNQRRAELLLRQLLASYPQSDKSADAAYQLGDLYDGRAYHQPRRAAWFFERSFQWNPHTQSDGRLRAARLYDKALQERARAIELYRDVLTHETDPKRIAEAQKRLSELSDPK